MSERNVQGRTIHLDGEWLPEDQAKVSVFDRGFLFADAVYEVTALAKGKLIDLEFHMARLERSLASLGISMPMATGDLIELHKEICVRNGLSDGLVYLQVTRGVQDRNFVVADDLRPTVMLFTQAKRVLENPRWATGISVRTVPDGRWANRHIKTVQLLYSSMAKTEAVRDGFDDALFVENGLITESCSANFHIVQRDGTLVTRELSDALLHGVTRANILDIARADAIPTEQRAFSVVEAQQASEAFITDSGGLVTPVVSIDRVQVGEGVPGPVTQRLRQLYIDQKLQSGICVSQDPTAS